jgi:outer membrane immunogenic protein
MRKIFLAGVAVSALMSASSAIAADAALPMLKAPAPLPVFSWTGCFVGGQVGWGWQRNKIDQSQFNTFTIAGTLVRLSSASSGNLDSSGGVFGGQVGCDYQFAGNFVAGVQGTFLGSNISRLGQDPHNGVVQTSNSPLGAGNVQTFSGGSIATRTRSLESVTGRLGYAGWFPQTMVYVRGGAAWVDTQLDMRSAAVGNFGPRMTPIFDTTYNGWTVGGGFEWMMATNWTAFVEYNHYDFKSKSIFARVFGPPNISGRTLASSLTVDTATIGVNYRFNWGHH